MCVVRVGGGGGGADAGQDVVCAYMRVFERMFESYLIFNDGDRFYDLHLI